MTTLRRILPREFGYVHVFLAGICLRMVYLWQAWHNNPLIDYPIVDARVYVDWARSILDAGLRWYEPSNYTPAYPLYLAFWFFLFGNAFRVIFCFFHVIGALQAVVIGKTAESLWDRKTGLIAGLLAATYWPFIVFEATFYAENLSLWSLSLGLLFLCRYTSCPKGRYLFASGLFMGVSALARVNMFLALAAVACWLAWDALRKETESSQSPGWLGRLRTATSRLCLYLLPIALLSAPIMLWNQRLTGSPILRTDAGSCLYLGNDPDLGGLIVSPGTPWTDLVHEPLRDGKTLSMEKETFWFNRTLETIRTRPADWIALQGKKLLMLVGDFEISQEIDIYRFRRSSSLLGLPVWPGFGLVFPLAVGGLLLAIRRRERRAAPLWLFVLAGFASIFPFQVASRFRLPLAVPLIPLAAAFAVWCAAHVRRPSRGTVAVVLLLILGYAVVMPDYTNLKTRNVIRHMFFVGLKKAGAGDAEGAIKAFSEAAALYPDDADALVSIGYLRLAKGEVDLARAGFKEAMRRQARCATALLGLAACAEKSGQSEEALSLLRQLLQEWPNNIEALRLQQRICLMREDWQMLEQTLVGILSYVNYPPDAAFQFAMVAERLGDPPRAVAAYDEISRNTRFGTFERGRAALYAGIVRWRCFSDSEGARLRWQGILPLKDALFGPLASCLLGGIKPGDLAGAFSPELCEAAAEHISYVLGIEAWMRSDTAAARRYLEEVAAARQAGNRPRHELTTLEFWALADLAVLEKGANAPSVVNPAPPGPQ